MTPLCQYAYFCFIVFFESIISKPVITIIAPQTHIRMVKQTKQNKKTHTLKSVNYQEERKQNLAQNKENNFLQSSLR